MSLATWWEIRDDDIRLRSYLIWESECCPHGQHLEHWLRAKQELRRELLRSARCYERAPHTITVAILPGVAQMAARQAA